MNRFLVVRLAVVLGVYVFGYTSVGAEPDRVGTFKPWGGAAVQEWANASKATALTDMNQCVPASALSTTLKMGRWKVIPYEMVGELKGNMVWAAPEAETPELTIPMNAKGWYAIFVGLFSTSEVPTVAWLRLNSDPAPVMRRNSRDDHYGNSEECFFKVAKLDENSSLCISQQNSGRRSACGVTHIKLIPLAEEEIEQVRADRGDVSHRTMAATIDGFSFIYHRSPRTVKEWLSEVEIYRNTDFGTLILQTPGADKVIYPSKVGHMKGTGYEVFPRIGDRYFVESIREMAEKKINPVKILIDGAHDVGMKVHVGIRPAGWSLFEPYTEYWESPFYRKNPQWRCVDRDGTPVARMSWAVPQVRKHLIDVLRELMGFGADGAHIVFNRGLPVVLYESAFCDMFQSQYGEDPKKIDESDPRIRKLWSNVVATFMQELRAMLDEEKKRRGDAQALELSIMVLGNEQDNTGYGIDVRRLVDQGLVDEVFMYLWGFGGTERGGYDLAFFREACEAKGVPFKPSTASRWNDGPHYTLGLIRSFLEAGCPGVAIWDADVGDIYQWSVISRLGHRTESLWRMDKLQNAQPPRTIYSFHKLGDQIRDGRFGPYWGG